MGDIQNREYQDRLSHKTSYLKSLALDIETEAKDSHRLLDGVDSDFDGTSGFLGSSLGRIEKMLGAGRSNRQIMCYVALLFVFVFFMLYYMMNKLSGSSSSSLSSPHPG